MKLFAKYNRVNLTATILVFVVGSIAFYFVLQFVLLRQLDDTLRVEQQEITDHTRKYDKLPDIQNTHRQWVTVKPAEHGSAAAYVQSVPLYDSAEKETESIRQLVFTIRAGTTFYEVTVNQSETETEDLLKLIILITVCMIGVILGINFFINRRLVTKLWRPFYQTIETIRDYHLNLQEPLQLRHEPIDEIDLLNDSLNKMTARINQDFIALRTFTENASHEMQTPLAVIRSKVEALIQDAEKNEKELGRLLSIDDATNRLARLHQSLLLLAKIENRQFKLNETVNLDQIIDMKLREREELVTSKSLRIRKNISPVGITFHHHLAEIWISNLLNNMIRYTPDNGEVDIILNTKTLTIRNTALGGGLDDKKIFNRFYKTEQSSEGTGLGLAIVQEICKLAGFTITYQYTGSQHDFTIELTGKGQV